MLFDIIIPTYNNFDELIICLKSLEKQTITDFKVWICVDGSIDKTLSYFQYDCQFNFNYQALQHADKKNHGRAATRNLPLKYLSSKYIVFLDSDLSVNMHFLENHLAILQQGNTVSNGKIIFENPVNDWGLYIQSRGKNRIPETTMIDYKFFESNNVALPTNYITACNGFDENFTVYGGEDTELGYRLWQTFHPSFYYNAEAIAHGRCNKSLEEGLQKRCEFAAYGLKYIRKIHPEFDTLFKIKFLESPAAQLLYHMIPLSTLKALLKKGNLPDYLKQKIIHLLVFYYQYKGYQTK